MLCALIQNNTVTAIIDLSQDQIPILGAIFEQVIDITSLNPQPIVGWLYDGSNIYNSTWKITKLAFESRLTTAEEAGIIGFALANYNNTGNPTLQGQALTIFALLRRQSNATYVDLQRSDTIAGVNALVSFGLLTSGRATTILTTPPALSEIYNG